MDTFEGKLVNLRPFRDEDAEFIANLRNDLRTQGWNQRLPPMHRPERIRERINEMMKERKNFGYLIIETKEGELVGTVDYTENPPRLGASIGIMTSMDYWGKGHALEALEMLFEFLFEERGLQVLWAWSTSRTVRALGAAKKLGFKESARVREGIILGGEVHDAIELDLLREEYYGLRGKEDRIQSDR